jgi:hypothetical protein
MNAYHTVGQRTIHPATPGLLAAPDLRIARRAGYASHLGKVPQSTDPAERPVYGHLETYRRTEPKGRER